MPQKYFRLWRKFEKSSKAAIFAHLGSDVIIKLQKGTLAKMNPSSGSISGFKSYYGPRIASKHSKIYLTQRFLISITLSYILKEV